jgi:hypothetical protein
MADESLTPLADASNAPTDGRLTATVGVTATDRDGVAVAGTVTGTLGKGWSLDAHGGWVHRTGWQIGATARWVKGK